MTAKDRTTEPDWYWCRKMYSPRRVKIYWLMLVTSLYSCQSSQGQEHGNIY